MAATFSQIQDALQAVFDAGWTATPLANVVRTNVGFDPAQLTPGAYWMSVVIRSGPQSTISLDDVFVGTPIMVVTAHVPMMFGQLTTQLLDNAIALFKGVQVAAGTSTLRFYAASAPVEVETDGWFSETVQLSFRLF